MHILEQHKNAVAKEKVNIVAVDSTHGKNSNASRTVGSSENLGGGEGGERALCFEIWFYMDISESRCNNEIKV